MKKRFLLSKDGKGAPLSDKELTKRFRETGDPRYFSMLFNRYTHLVYGTCRKYIQSPEECRDLTMEIFEKALEILPKTEVSAFNNWIYTVTRNQCISWLRAQEKIIQEEESYLYSKNSEVLFMENEAFLRLLDEDKTSATEIVALSMGQLEENQRICVRLFFFENKSYKAIEQHTGFTAKQVKSYLQNGKRRLKLIIHQLIEDQKRK
jgi:RNA polymerase sigma-70 factor (ECF subfamily)